MSGRVEDYGHEDMEDSERYKFLQADIDMI